MYGMLRSLYTVFQSKAADVVQREMEESALTSDDSKEVKCLLMSCTVCEESFSEDRVPRNLTCGHSLCQTCTEQCLSGDRYCPECHTLLKEKDVTKLPINYGLLRLSQMVVKNEMSLEDIVGPLPLVLEPVPTTDREENSLECPSHGTPTAFLCISCSMWVCRDCLATDHPYMPRGSCRILGMTEAIENMRKVFKRETNASVRLVKSIKNRLQPELARVEFLAKHCHSDNRSHSRLDGIVRGMLDKLKKEDKTFVSCAMALMKKSMKEMKTTTSAERAMTLCKELVDCRNSLKDYIAKKEEEAKDDLNHEILIHLTMDLKLLVEGGAPVYAVLQGPSGTKWAPVLSRGNYRQVVYSLRDGKPPAEGITVPYEYVREMVPKNYPSVFFEFGTENEAKGFVYVRLFRNSPRVRNVVFLCSGEGGLCYRGTSLFRGEQTLLTFQGGDLEKNDGTGSNNCLDRQDDYIPREELESFSGCSFMCVERSFSKFGFDPTVKSKLHRRRLGIVTHGDDLVKFLCSSDSLSDCMVRECGFFLPRNIEVCDTAEIAANDRIYPNDYWDYDYDEEDWD